MWLRTAQHPGCGTIALLAAFIGFLHGCRLASAIHLDPYSEASIKAAAKTAAEGLWSFYSGWMPGQVPGLLPDPYYWWEGGAMMMTLVDYWDATGDTQFNKDVTEAMLWQAGPLRDYMNVNQSFDTGNDDQAFWAFAAMEAAENNFPNPPPKQAQWLPLVQAVFNEQVYRWKGETLCGGGLMWQTNDLNPGWGYKNSISNGCFFSMGARLYRYTGNSSYGDWAIKAWDWTRAIGLMSDSYQVFDGTTALRGAKVINCTDINRIQWTYNVGVFLHGAANMWNVTKDPIWKARVNGLLKYSMVFFRDGVMSDVGCEPQFNCNYDQRSFKAYLSRWMAATAQLAPWTYNTIYPLLVSSAAAAAKQCSGGDNGTTCGLRWTEGSTWDGSSGPGEQMAAMSVFNSLLVNKTHAPFTAQNGGTSVSRPGAGTPAYDPIDHIYDKKITTGDRAGAGILTVVVLGILLTGGWWMMR